jgi:hypothetical protein
MENAAIEQRHRIDRIVKELIPHAVINYDSETPGLIGFKILDNNTNIVLAATTSPLRVQELTGKSDDWVRRFISQLGGGDL